jgi:glutathione S-transferase
MKLHYSPASQYVRKVMIVAHELGVAGRIALIHDRAGLDVHNPLLKRPALVLDDGRAIVDSPVICAYLDATFGGGLIPRDGPARWAALSQEALADGVMEAVTAIRIERAFHAGEESAEWIDRQMRKIAGGLDAFEGAVSAGDFAGPLTIGHICLAALCGYLDFLFADYDWRAGRPALARWHAAMAQRPSMQKTTPRLRDGEASALAPRRKS